MIGSTWKHLSLLAAVSILAAGCGGEGKETFEPLAPEDPGPVHVHGLGIDPEDGSLFIATHTGLYRVGKDEQKAARVGDRYQDTMGFTVVGPNRFLGSGHPDVREAREKDLLPLLGLIRSEDAGESWDPISLLGEADFHILRFASERVYGFDATNNRLMVSRDGGESWTTQTLPGLPPKPLIDLVADPDNPEHVIGASQGGLYESTEGGGTWKRLARPIGLLAWPARERLYLVTGGGQVFVSANGGSELSHVGQIGGEPAAFLAVSAQELYVALHDGTIERSTDGGASWTVRSTP